MKNLYDINGLFFWTEEEIKIRQMLESYFTSKITESLKTQNPGFEIIQVEAPLLTPKGLINKNYSSEDVFTTNDELTMRPETTMGSYVYATEILNKHNKRKVRMPLVVWQHGKSFRNEQDQVTTNMRLKEFYQLEYQILYSEGTKNDYSVV